MLQIVTNLFSFFPRLVTFEFWLPRCFSKRYSTPRINKTLGLIIVVAAVLFSNQNKKRTLCFLCRMLLLFFVNETKRPHFYCLHSASFFFVTAVVDFVFHCLPSAFLLFDTQVIKVHTTRLSPFVCCIQSRYEIMQPITHKLKGLPLSW